MYKKYVFLFSYDNDVYAIRKNTARHICTNIDV